MVSRWLLPGRSRAAWQFSLGSAGRTAAVHGEHPRLLLREILAQHHQFQPAFLKKRERPLRFPEGCRDCRESSRVALVESVVRQQFVQGGDFPFEGRDPRGKNFQRMLVMKGELARCCFPLAPLFRDCLRRTDELEPSAGHRSSGCGERLQGEYQSGARDELPASKN